MQFGPGSFLEIIEDGLWVEFHHVYVFTVQSSNFGKITFWSLILKDYCFGS